MSVTFRLFERWCAQKGFQSRRAGALALGLSHAAAEHWKAGRNGSLAVLERMATDLGEDYVPHVMAAFQETAPDEAERKAWRRLAKRLGAASVVGLALLAGSAPAPSYAASEAVSDHPEIYIMRTVPRRRRTRKARPGDPGISPDAPAPDGAAWCRPFREWKRYAAAALPCSRSTHERLRSQRLRRRGAGSCRSRRRVARLAA